MRSRSEGRQRSWLSGQDVFVWRLKVGVAEAKRNSVAGERKSGAK